MKIRNELLKRAYDGSYYTISGAGGEIKDWKDGYAELLCKEGIGTITEWIEFSGKDMNEEFKLTNKNRYPDSFQFLAFPLSGLDVGKLAMFRLRMGDRWFDDIVDNNKAREKAHSFS